MKKTTDTNSGVKRIRSLMADDLLLTEADVDLLVKRTALKAKLKKLDDQLKPKIAATIEQHGIGRIAIGNRIVELKESERQSYSWKAITYAVASEAEIDTVKDDFALEYKIHSVKVVQ